jgi:hypothetical protein
MGLDTKPVSSAWIPGRLHRARSSKANPSSTVLDPYICIDSGASRDLFPDRSYFTDYTDISHQGHYVIVADDSHISIHGIGIGRYQLSGHEVILRKVYHVPKLNAPLFSIWTHCRRGPSCSLIADHLGCWLTFVLDIHNAEYFLLPIAPSNPRSSTLSPYPFDSTSSLLDASRPTSPSPAAAVESLTLSPIFSRVHLRLPSHPPHPRRPSSQHTTSQSPTSPPPSASPAPTSIDILDAASCGAKSSPTLAPAFTSPTPRRLLYRSAIPSQ